MHPGLRGDVKDYEEEARCRKSTLEGLTFWEKQMARAKHRGLSRVELKRQS